MSKDRIWLFDTTLRDGGQTRGVDFSHADKQAIAAALDDIGIDYIEGGWPGANPTDDAFFGNPPKTRTARMVAFGMTRHAGRSTSNDPGLNAVLDAEVPATCLVGKTWDFHVETALKTTLEENLDMIAESVKAAAERGRESMFDCEHFFDGFKNNPDYALDCVRAAHEGGASWVILCDTNGGALTEEVSEIVGHVAGELPEVRLGIHCHNDCGLAVANSLAAVKAGARQIQGTINGIGERCGNADMISIIPTLVLKLGLETGVSEERLPRLMGLSRMLDERLNRAPNSQAPYVGESAFAHKGGLHASAARKDPRTYEHVEPGRVGNVRRYLVSDQAGKSNMLERFAEFGIEIDPKDERIGKLMRIVKEREFDGWAYDSAEASFELLARRMLADMPDYFTIGRFRVMDERRFNAKGELVVESEATATISVGRNDFHEVAVGNGPVNAVDTAIRKSLASAYPQLEDVRLVDYKVRILSPRGDESGTRAVTRVLIEFAAPDGVTWRTVGLSTNIIDASVVALGDGMAWRLFHEGAKVPNDAA